MRHLHGSRDGPAVKDRHYSLVIPAFMDAALALVQTTVPLLALAFRASDILLSTIGWVPQAVRLPVCLTAGRLSERAGRIKVIIPGACLVAVGAAGLAAARSNVHVIISYTLVLAAMGVFYPPLQALIGDVSKPEQLARNLGAFNVGWCTGGALAGLGAAALVRIDLSLAPLAAVCAALTSGALVLFWRRSARRDGRPAEETEEGGPAPAHATRFLLIARMSHFTGYFGFATIRILFPKLGLSLGWSRAEVAVVVAMLLAGQAAGILTSSASPWWRGKIWPQLAAQSTMLACAVATTLASSPVLLGATFFGLGTSLGVSYSAALYHGLFAGKDRGRNTGIHESLVAAGNVAGCLLGGVAAQTISARAPYILFGCVAGACLLSTAVMARGLRGRRCASQSRAVTPGS